MTEPTTVAPEPPRPGHPPTRCANCRNSDRRVIRKVRERRYGMPGEFLLVRCTGCGLVRTEPPPPDAAAYYPMDDYYAYRPPGEPSARQRRRIQDAYRPVPRSAPARLTGRWLAPGMPPGPVGRVLDVGCGSGGFLKHLETAGWATFGVEPSESAVSAAHAARLENVRCGELPDAGLPDSSFDAVRFWHVLEHIEEPRAALEEARRLLRPGGSLTVGVPNRRSLLARVARDNWFFLDVPRHLWHFDKRTLRELVEGCGFSVERLRTSTSPTSLLGTLDYRRGGGERLLASRKAFYAGLPVTAGLDLAGVGCGLELIARRPGGGADKLPWKRRRTPGVN